MDKFVVELNLQHVRDARAAINAKTKEANADIEAAMTRLIHEAAAQMMSVSEVAKHSGFTVAQIKSRMKILDLNPTKGKRLLSKHAAKVLAENAALMGIDPTKMDLMSPLAYLPAGDVTAFLETQVKPDIDEMLDEAPLVHAVDYQDDSITCGITAWDAPILIVDDPDQLTCPGCMTRFGIKS